LGQQVVERLILARADLFGDREPPLFGVVEDGIDVEDHAAEGVYAVPYDLTDPELGLPNFASNFTHLSPRACFNRGRPPDGRPLFIAEAEFLHQSAEGGLARPLTQA